MSSNLVAHLLMGNHKSEVVRDFYRHRNIVLRKGMHRIKGPASSHEGIHTALFLKVFLGKLQKTSYKELSSSEQSFLLLQYFIESYREYVDTIQEIGLLSVLPADWAFVFWNMMNSTYPEYILCECNECGDITTCEYEENTEVICNFCKTHRRFSIDTNATGFTWIEEIPFVHLRKVTERPSKTFEIISRVKRNFDKIGT